MEDQEQRDVRIAELEEALSDEGLPERERNECEVELARLRATPAVIEETAPIEVIDRGVAADPQEFMATGGELVVAGERPVFVVLDAHDENAVLDALTARGTKRLFYDFEHGGKRVVDLSIHGVLEAVNLMNRTGKCRIAIEPSSAVVVEEAQEGKRYVKARVYAHDAIGGFGVFGMAKQEVMASRRSGPDVFDPFAETKALNKAQRNALGMMIPQRIRQAMIAQATGNTTLMREVEHGVGAAAVAELPPPLNDERAREQVAQARALYDELRALNFKAMLPGQFAIGLQRAQHSHDMLDTFLAELRARVEHETEKTS